MADSFLLPPELEQPVQLLSHFGACVQLFDGDRTLFVNDRLVELLGYPRQRFAQQGFYQAIALPDDRAGIVERDQARRQRAHHLPERLTGRLVAASGEVVQLQWTVVSVNYFGTPCFMAIGRDESEIVAMERELALYRGAFESAGRGLAIWSRHAEDEEAFELALTNGALPWDVAPGSTPAALGPCGPMVTELLRKALGSTEPVVSPDFQLAVDGGEVRSFRALARANGPLHASLTVEDVTFQRQLDREIYRVQKNEQLAMLSGTIAHDFSNLLTAVHTFAELGRETLQDDPETTDYFFAQIAQTAMQASQLSRNLLRFSRRDSGTPRAVSIGAEVAKFQPILQALTRGKAELRMDVTNSSWSAYLDPIHLEQVIVNLVGNANDAVDPHTGRIEVEVSDVPAGATPGREGDYVRIVVRDNGSGIDPEDMARVFEPYFSRKDERGTGLGLAICQKIVLQYLGDIRLESERGVGTTFEVLLPRHEDSASISNVLVEELAPLAGRERVLLVEDQDGLREVLVSFLERLGYAASGASTAAAAMDIAVAEQGNIDVLVADIELEDSNGPELARRLRVQWPGIRVLFVSGASHPDQHQRGNIAASSSAFLAKPFTARQLARQLRLLMDGPTAETT